MTKKKKIKTIVISIIVIIILSWKFKSYFNLSTEINNGVYIEKEKNNSYSVFFNEWQKVNSWKSRRKLVDIKIRNVDSLIVSQEYGTMIYGKYENTQFKKWYYFDASEHKNMFGPWDDSIFRKNEIVAIGNEYLDSVTTPEKIIQLTNRRNK